MITLRLIRATTTALAGVAVTLAQLNLPSKQFWDGQAPLLYASVAVVAVFVVVDAVRSFDQALQIKEIRKYEVLMAHTLSAATRRVVDTFAVPWDQVAVYHYQARGFRPWRRLHRVSAVRAGAPVMESPARLAVGQGIPGQAFRDRQLIGVQWADFVSTAIAAGPQAWDQRDEEKRYGMNWGQLNTFEKPEGFVANPVFDDEGRLYGSTAVSGPLKSAELTSDEMRRVLSDLASALKQAGPAPRGWWNSRER